MSALIGEHTCKLDAKGRMMLPARFKAALLPVQGTVLYLRMGFDPCIEVLDQEGFDALSKEVRALSDFDPESRKVKRRFSSSFVEVVPDANGRFLLPKRLQEFANLGKEVYVVGVMGAVRDHLELWNEKDYNAYSYGDDHEQYGEKVTKLLGS